MWTYPPSASCWCEDVRSYSTASSAHQIFIWILIDLFEYSCQGDGIGMISHVFFWLVFFFLFFWGLFALSSATWFMSLLTISPGIRQLRSDLLAPFAIRPLYCVSLLGWLRGWMGSWRTKVEPVCHREWNGISFVWAWKLLKTTKKKT